MKYSIIRVTETGERQDVGQATTERQASKVASQAARGGNGKIFIEWFRPSDGQHGYLNRNGHDITGKAW